MDVLCEQHAEEITGTKINTHSQQTRAYLFKYLSPQSIAALFQFLSTSQISQRASSITTRTPPTTDSQLAVASLSLSLTDMSK